METNFKRKEVWLHDTVIDRLQKLADKKKWSLKLYMEGALIKDSLKALPAKERISTKLKNGKK